VKITAENLGKALRLTPEAAEFWAPKLDEACFLYGIDTAPQKAAFVAQCAHESANFTRLVENLRYTRAERIAQVWPRLFPTPAAAEPYVNDPMRLAAKVYAGVNGNGDEDSLDGWTYRGRGLFQITGRGNYAKVAKATNEDLIRFPALLEHPNLAALSAAFWWDLNDLNQYADGGAIDKISGVINRGDPNKPAIGRAERAYAFNNALEAFA
jgi:putative chitinase